MSELKPCPFCGGSARIVENEGEYRIYHCVEENPDCPIADHRDNGGTMGAYWYFTCAGAIEAWNTRAEK